MQRARARLGMFAQIKGPELGKGGVTLCHHCKPGISICAELGASGIINWLVSGAALLAVVEPGAEPIAVQLRPARKSTRRGES